MRKMIPVLVLWLAAIGWAQDKPAATLKAGDMAPEFTLKDQTGKEVSLKDFRGKNVALAFYVFAFTGG